MLLNHGFVATRHGSTATIAQDVFSLSALATEHGSGALTVEDVSSPPPVATEHSSSATLSEDVLEVVIPFLTMNRPAHTMCDPKEGCTPILKTGEHVHIWCYTCANLPCDHHCAATHDACPDCRILRTIIQVSLRWEKFMWDLSPLYCPFCSSSSSSSIADDADSAVLL
jgi:hypothetical protein